MPMNGKALAPAPSSRRITAFDLAKGVSPDEGIRRMRAAHNQADSATKSWSYGPTYQKGICATGSKKTAGCNGGSYTGCGSNTYPTGVPSPRVEVHSMCTISMATRRSI